MSRYFWSIFPPPLPPVTLRHTSRDPPESTSHISDPPNFRRPSTKNPDKSPLKAYKFCLKCSRGVSSEGLLSGRFCPGWFLSVPVPSKYICYIRRLNITLNFMFRMYDKKIYKYDVPCSLLPLPCHKLSHLL